MQKCLILLATPAGFEPATFSLEDRGSGHLNFTARLSVNQNAGVQDMPREKLVAPVSSGAAALRIFFGQCITISFAAVVAANLQRAVHPWLKGVVCRLEGKYE
jgi:hypothetical protein